MRLCEIQIETGSVFYLTYFNFDSYRHQEYNQTLFVWHIGL